MRYVILSKLLNHSEFLFPHLYKRDNNYIQLHRAVLKMKWYFTHTQRALTIICTCQHTCIHTHTQAHTHTQSRHGDVVNIQRMSVVLIENGTNKVLKYDFFMSPKFCFLYFQIWAFEVITPAKVVGNKGNSFWEKNQTQLPAAQEGGVERGKKKKKEEEKKKKEKEKRKKN